MLAESFSRYIKEFRKPCGRKRIEMIARHNKKLQYSQIQPENHSNNPLRNINKVLKETGNAFSNLPNLKQLNSRVSIFEKQEELKEYKEQLEKLNEKANTMFEHMKRINKLVSKKVMEIESAVTKSETIFVDEINKLIKNKQELNKIDKKTYIKKYRGHRESLLPGSRPVNLI